MLALTGISAVDKTKIFYVDFWNNKIISFDFKRKISRKVYEGINNILAILIMRHDHNS